jgi:hypothetical protein
LQAEREAEIVCVDAGEMQGQLQKRRQNWREIVCAGIPPLNAAVFKREGSTWRAGVLAL